MYRILDGYEWVMWLYVTHARCCFYPPGVAEGDIIATSGIHRRATHKYIAMLYRALNQASEWSKAKRPEGGAVPKKESVYQQRMFHNHPRKRFST